LRARWSGERIKHWRGLIAALEEVIPFYERVNFLLSFGKAQRWRAMGLERLTTGRGAILDAGIGPGNMSAAAIQTLSPRAIIGLDSSLKMLKEAHTSLKEADFLQGVFESLPFKAGVLDAVLCGFSLRDALNLEESLIEFRRVLSERGELLVVDVGKPDNPLIRRTYELYWRFVVPLLARVAARWMARSNPWGWLVLTYRALPQNSRLRQTIACHFGKVDMRRSRFGLVNLIVAVRAE